MVLSVIKYTILQFLEILNPEAHQNRITGSKVKAILRGFCLLVELYREGSAPAACAGGVFIQNLAKVWQNSL